MFNRKLKREFHKLRMKVIELDLKQEELLAECEICGCALIKKNAQYVESIEDKKDYIHLDNGITLPRHKSVIKKTYYCKRHMPKKKNKQ